MNMRVAQLRFPMKRNYATHSQKVEVGDRVSVPHSYPQSAKWELSWYKKLLAGEICFCSIRAYFAVVCNTLNCLR